MSEKRSWALALRRSGIATPFLAWLTPSAAAHAQQARSLRAYSLAQDLARDWFALLGDPPAARVDHWIDWTLALLAPLAMGLLALVSRSRRTPRGERKRAQREHVSGFGSRPALLRRCGLCLAALGLGFGAFSALAVARYGTLGDQLTAHSQLVLTVSLELPSKGIYFSRAHAFNLRSEGGGERLVFKFPEESAIKELWVPAIPGEPGDIALEFNAPDVSPLRVAERDCTGVRRTLRLNQVALTTSTGLVPEGELHMSCPERRLQVHAILLPGLSATQEEEFGRTPLVRHAGELGIAAALLLFVGVVLSAQGFSAPFDDGRADNLAQASAKLGGMIGLGVIGLLAAIRTVMPSRAESDVVDLTPDHLAGCLHASTPFMGMWTGSPERCLISSVGSYRWLVLEYSRPGGLRELRVDTARAGERTLELHFFDPKRPIQRLHERDCDVFEVPVSLQRYRMNAREVERVSGEVHLSCPRLSLEVHSSFRGCEGR